MMATTVIFCASIGVLPEPTAQPADLAAYQTVKANAGRDPDSQIKLALWCERTVCKPTRQHLALAVLSDPKNATRGLMGLVAYAGRWGSPRFRGGKSKGRRPIDGRLAQYNAKRDKTPNTADAQYKLAFWCEEKGLKAEASAHFTTVVTLDPSREAAWKKLGCKKVNGRWLASPTSPPSRPRPTRKRRPIVLEAVAVEVSGHSDRQRRLEACRRRSRRRRDHRPAPGAFGLVSLPRIGMQGQGRASRF